MRSFILSKEDETGCACWKIRNVYKIFVGKSEEERFCDT
jgi:hypothetical protein